MVVSRDVAEDEAGGDDKERAAVEVELGPGVADEGRDEAADRAVGGRRGGRGDGDEVEGAHLLVDAVAAQVEDGGALADVAHLPLGEAFGEGGVVGDALEEVVVDADLLFEVGEVPLELLALP